MKTFFISLGIALLAVSQLQAQKLLQLYGGKNHDQFLGCINCNDYDANSIWNTAGNYGSKYNSYSIWNDAGAYGNKNSNYCPFNESASSPPIIKDNDGNIYGYLTINKYHENRADNPVALTIYAHWKVIPQNIQGWYKKIFNNN